MPTSLPPSLTDRAADAAVSGRRADVLARLHATGRPCSVTEMAQATGLHVNTARFHLDGLVADGLAERAAEPRAIPGRPRILYTAHGAVPGPRSYRLLAEMLTGLVSAAPDAGAAALAAGRHWGRHLVERTAPWQQVDATEAVHRLNRLLDAVGFQPETHPGAGTTDTEVRLRHCPFLEVAERHRDVVCAIHLGLMRGALEELRAPVEAASLAPFVTPSLCVAQLRTATAAG
ncbi:MAG: helix-turn-helix transcriptional regulator [Actinomycetota bacterium]